MKFKHSIGNQKVNLAFSILGIPCLVLGLYIGGVVGFSIAAVGLFSLRVLTL